MFKCIVCGKEYDSNGYSVESMGCSCGSNIFTTFFKDVSLPSIIATKNDPFYELELLVSTSN